MAPVEPSAGGEPAESELPPVVASGDSLPSTLLVGGGAILPAIEPRIRVNLLYVAGLNFQRALPECDQINYVTRVTQPTLMLNGELDFFFPFGGLSNTTWLPCSAAAPPCKPAFCSFCNF